MRFVMITLFACLIGSTLSFAQTKKTIRTEAELMPYFPGCEEFDDGSEQKRQCSNHALVGYLSQSIQYPEDAIAQGIEGTVYVSFVVGEYGEITNVSMIRDIGGGCGEEAMRVIREMPVWEPAIDGEQTVAVKLNIPVQFFMKAAEEDLADNFKINWGTIIGEKVSKELLIENLDRKIIVRDQSGNATSVSNLYFVYQRRKSLSEAQSTGNISNDMRKLVKKAKKGGTLAVTASLVKNGSFVDVTKVYEIVD